MSKILYILIIAGQLFANDLFIGADAGFSQSWYRDRSMRETAYGNYANAYPQNWTFGIHMTNDLTDRLAIRTDVRYKSQSIRLVNPDAVGYYNDGSTMRGDINYRSLRTIQLTLMSQLSHEIRQWGVYGALGSGISYNFDLYADRRIHAPSDPEGDQLKPINIPIVFKLGTSWKITNRVYVYAENDYTIQLLQTTENYFSTALKHDRISSYNAQGGIRILLAR